MANTPDFTPQHGALLEPTEETLDITNVLDGYRSEAEQARAGGPNPRDAKWDENLDLYWNRYDFSHKADWQAQEVMPEVPAFVDRFAAALKEALVANYDHFYTVTDPTDKNNNLAQAIKRMMDVWLSGIGKSPNGTLLSFPAVFEEQAKLGALTACCGSVVWREDVRNGRVAFETHDPRFVWLDHTFRNLYRFRRMEIDRHEIARMRSTKDRSGRTIFNESELDRLEGSMGGRDMQADQEAMSGHGHENQSTRKTIEIEEWIATVVNNDGKVVEENALIVVANRKYIIRGPEKNPFWHGGDWLLHAPLVTAPLSVYGRSYMEDFGSLARTFTELTNLLLDAAYTSSLKAFVIVPGMLSNPEQAAEGIHPGKLFQLEEGFRAEDFAKELELGTLDQGGIQMWQAMKNELTEAADVNEVGLGQFAPNSRTSATEVSAALQNSSALIRSVANTVETRFIDPALDLIWKTGLQHVRRDDARMAGAAGPELFNALHRNRKEIIRHPFTFKARGISAMIQKSQMLQSLLQTLQIIAQSDRLTMAFAQEVSMDKLMRLLFELSNVDLNRIEKSDQEKQIQELTEQLQQRQQQAGAGAEPTEENRREMADVARRTGIQR